MNLTEKTYRACKAILQTLPGAPSSARLTEVLAKALCFEDSRDMQRYFDSIEIDLDTPQEIEFDEEFALEALFHFGCNGWPAKDIVATAQAVLLGGWFWELTDESSLLNGAAVCRFDVTNDRWKNSLERAWRRISSAPDIIGLMIDQAELKARKGAGEMGFVEHVYVMRPDFDGEPILEAYLGSEMDRDGDAGEVTVEDIMLNIASMIAPGLPEEIGADSHDQDDGFEEGAPQAPKPREPLVRAIVLDGRGLRAYCVAPSSGLGFDIWFAVFEGAEIDRRPKLFRM